MHMFEINYFALFAAAASQWAIGALWFGLIFRKSWKRLVGNAPQSRAEFVFSLVCFFLAGLMLSYVLVHLIQWAGTLTFVGGAALAIICWLGLMAPPLFVQHVHEKRPVNLFAINAGYWVAAMAMSGGILAVWR